jgi:putative RecB family exonuclease
MTVEHLSYSSLSTYLSCPRSYYLSRVKQAEGSPAWYFAIGTAVHRAIELHLKQDPLSSPRSVEDIFYSEVSRLMDIEPDTSLWLHGGSKEQPVIEERALKLAEDCYEAALIWLEDFEVWEVEPDITGYLPGCGLPIKAFPDATGEHKRYGPAIVDWKTGKSKPKDNLQLETYRALLLKDVPDLSHMEHDYTGVWVMLNPDAPKARPVKLIETPESMGAMYAELERKVKQGAYPANIQYNCRFCSMAPNCKLKSGATKRSLYYDTPEKDGGIPF